MANLKETSATVDPRSAPPRFHVTIQCPTPVAFPELDVEADDEVGAWRAFCSANGISDSEHPRTIVRV